MRPWAKAGIALAGSLLASTAGAVIIEEVVANVNGDIITKTELEQREREVQESLYSSLSGEELDTALAKFRRTVLVDMINEKLLFQRGLRMGLDLEQVYQSSLESIMRQNNINTKDELVKILEQQGLTVPEFRDSVLKFNVPDIMINIEVRRKISITDSEVAEYYQKHKGDFSNPVTYTFREIAILRPDHSKAESIEIAEKILAEAAAGEDFMALVRTHSEAPSQDQAGLIESVTPDDMSPEILKALESLEPGELSPPVVTGRAVLVLKLEEKQDAHEDPLEAVRSDIEGILKQEKYERDLEEYLKSLWVDSHIVTTPKYEERYPTAGYR